jgi:hypothetical protein
MSSSPFLKAIIPAGVLAALVLFVFATLQNYGPESAVRRFHEAVLERNQTEVDDVILHPANAGEVSKIEKVIWDALSQGAHIRLHDLSRTPTKVTVTVIYHAGDQSGYQVWATQKTSNGWKVDIHRTWQLWNSASRASPPPDPG